MTIGFTRLQTVDRILVFSRNEGLGFREIFVSVYHMQNVEIIQIVFFAPKVKTTFTLSPSFIRI